MKLFGKLTAFLIAAFVATAAYGQGAGTVTNHAFAIGKGAGVQGYTSLLCGAGQLAVAQAGADPICRTVSGDWTLNAAGVSTLATVNANVGAFGSATNCPTITLNAKGLATAATQTTCTPAVGSITGLGTGVATALAINLGSNGAMVVFNGSLGTPASGVATNLTGTAAGLNVGGTAGGLTGARTTLPTIQRLTSLTPNSTYTTPANVLWLEITAKGAGGGGGAANTNSGTTGTDTCFGTNATACTTPIFTAGGALGGGPSLSGPRSGGAASGGNVDNLLGGPSTGVTIIVASSEVGGNGGNNGCGGGAGIGGGAPGNGGAAATNSGAGGGGAGGTGGANGGAGGGGGACVRHIINTPAGSYKYTIGAKGTGGAAGTNAGGDGGDGVIIVIEHYGT